MEQKETLELLKRVQAGELAPEQALHALKTQPFTDIGYAKVDHHRALRKGSAEVIYGEGKTAEQICGILDSMEAAGQRTALITRLDAQKAEIVMRTHPLDYRAVCRIGIAGKVPEPDGASYIVVCTGGTSDIPVAEEAAVTAEALGSRVVRLYDVGVAGIHRLLSNMDELMDARCVVAVAGMEGALASVVGGLVDCPVIAVPTSVGYGASFHGLAALLSMLNSCSSGCSVVNIDNGFGAGYLANMINHIGC